MVCQRHVHSKHACAHVSMRDCVCMQASPCRATHRCAAQLALQWRVGLSDSSALGVKQLSDLFRSPLDTVIPIHTVWFTRCAPFIKYGSHIVHRTGVLSLLLLLLLREGAKLERESDTLYHNLDLRVRTEVGTCHARSGTNGRATHHRVALNRHHQLALQSINGVGQQGCVFNIGDGSS